MKVVLVTLLLSVTCAQAAEVSGIPRIVDGDTVQIGDTKIRLAGSTRRKPTNYVSMPRATTGPAA